MLTVISQKIAIMLPYATPKTPSNNILNKIRHKVEEIIGNNSWSGAEYELSEIEMLVGALPEKYRQHVYQFAANTIDNLLRSYDPDHVGTLLQEYIDAFLGVNPAIDAVLETLQAEQSK